MKWVACCFLYAPCSEILLSIKGRHIGLELGTPILKSFFTVIDSFPVCCFLLKPGTTQQQVDCGTLVDIAFHCHHYICRLTIRQLLSLHCNHSSWSVGHLDFVKLVIEPSYNFFTAIYTCDKFCIPPSCNLLFRLHPRHLLSLAWFAKNSLCFWIVCNDLKVFGNNISHLLCNSLSFLATCSLLQVSIQGSCKSRKEAPYSSLSSSFTGTVPYCSQSSVMCCPKQRRVSGRNTGYFRLAASDSSSIDSAQTSDGTNELPSDSADSDADVDTIKALGSNGTEGKGSEDKDDTIIEALEGRGIEKGDKLDKAGDDDNGAASGEVYPSGDLVFKKKGGLASVLVQCRLLLAWPWQRVKKGSVLNLKLSGQVSSNHFILVYWFHRSSCDFSCIIGRSFSNSRPWLCYLTFMFPM